jgi:hypothetical protein
MKVGLVCDGSYNVSEMMFKKFNNILFADKDYTNSNPLPKEWMEAFGLNYEFSPKEVKYEDICAN